MNTKPIWKLGIAAALLYGLSACSDTVSSESEDETSNNMETSYSYTTTTTSSASRGSTECDTLIKLSSPTDLSVIKDGTNKWVLFWNYEENENRPENGFVIEILNMSDSLPKWKVLDHTNADVTMYNLVGESKSGKYYRISAEDDCGTSKPSEIIQVTASASTQAANSMELAVPQELKLDTLDNNMWQLSWSYTNNANRPENGFVLQSLNLTADSVKWKNDGTTNKGVHVIIIDGNKKGGYLFHVAAKDSNGLSEYSEEITIPRVSDDSTLNKNNATALAVPANIKLDSLSDTLWQLSWTYEKNANRPEKGFIIQKLDLTTSNPSWTKDRTTQEGVKYANINIKTYGGQFMRVAAYDDKGNSAFSEEISIPKKQSFTEVENADLAVPTDLKLDTLGENKWQISWSYTNNPAVPENGFQVQSLDIDAATPVWTDYTPKVSKGVHYVIINNAEGATQKYYRIAAIDKKGNIGDYSTEIMVPRYSENPSSTNTKTQLAVPTDLKLDSLGPNLWRLGWSYVNNADRPENGFQVQVLDLRSTTTPEWKVYDATNKGVRFYVIDASKDDFKQQPFVRIAAKDSVAGAPSEEIQVPAYVDPTAIPETNEVLAVPANLKADSVGENTYRITWTYTANSKRPNENFVIETLDPLATNPVWESFKTLSASVKVYTFDNTYCGKYVRVIAKDAGGESDPSNEIQIPQFKDYSADHSLLAPTNLKIDSVGVNMYRISWSYADNKNRKAVGFKYRVLDPAVGTWGDPEIISNTTDVKIKDLSATEFGGKYISVAAYDNATTDNLSSFTDGVLVPTLVEIREEFNVPTNVRLDSIAPNKYRISWSYTENKNKPSDGFDLQILKPAADADWVALNTTKTGIKIFDIDVESTDAIRYVKVAAKNGTEIGTYSEEVQIPAYIDYNTLTLADLAVPTGLAIEDIGGNFYKLSWSYTNNADRPENGFYLQEIDPNADSPAWKIVDSTNTGVHFIKVEAKEDHEITYRIAAKDANGRSEFSESINLPKYSAIAPADGCVGTFPAPTSLIAERIAPRVWRIVWNYNQNKKCLEQGFEIQKLNVSATGAREWVHASSTNRNVNYINLAGNDNLDQYYRVAAYRGEDTTTFSNDVILTRSTPYSSEYSFGTPSLTSWLRYGGDANIVMEFAINSNFPNHTMLNSEYTKEFTYQFRLNGQDEAQWTSITVTKDGVYNNAYVTAPMDVVDFCRSYASVRIVWEDIEGNKDYTEWSTPVGPYYKNFPTIIQKDKDGDGKLDDYDLCSPN